MSKSSMRRYLESHDDYLVAEYDDMPDVDRSKPDPGLEKWKREHGWDFTLIARRPKPKRAA